MRGTRRGGAGRAPQITGIGCNKVSGVGNVKLLFRTGCGVVGFGWVGVMGCTGRQKLLIV